MRLDDQEPRDALRCLGWQAALRIAVHSRVGEGTTFAFTALLAG